MEILDLPLKKEWFNRIESGEKLEEYREITPYWINKLCTTQKGRSVSRFLATTAIARGMLNQLAFKNIDLLRFRYGYTKRTMERKLISITIGIGRKEWGAPDHEVFILKFTHNA